MSVIARVRSGLLIVASAISVAVMPSFAMAHTSAAAGGRDAAAGADIVGPALSSQRAGRSGVETIAHRGRPGLAASSGLLHLAASRIPRPPDKPTAPRGGNKPPELAPGSASRVLGRGSAPGTLNDSDHSPRNIGNPHVKPGSSDL